MCCIVFLSCIKLRMKNNLVLNSNNVFQFPEKPDEQGPQDEPWTWAATERERGHHEQDDGTQGSTRKSVNV